MYMAKKLASPNAKDTNMLVFLALGDAKVPNVNDFASQWNIGFNPIFHQNAKLLASGNLASPNARYPQREKKPPVLAPNAKKNPVEYR